MTIDERIEALTQSVAILASFHRDQDRHFAELAERTEQHLGKLSDHMGTLAGAMTELAHVAKNHEQRIQDLEDGEPHR